MKKTFIILFILSSLNIIAQNQKKEKNNLDPIEGHWIGTITQDEEGNKTVYKFEMFISRKGDSLFGRTNVFADDIYCTMNFNGEIKKNKYMIFEEDKIIDMEIKKGLEWCLKKGELIKKEKYGNYTLEGIWQGNTSFGNCTPGRIFLKKVKDRV